MVNTVVLPRAFRKQEYYRFLELDGIACGKYHHFKDHSDHQVVITTCLFVFVLGGKKVLHLGAGDLVIDAGDAFFAQKDSYMYSEFIATDSRFQSLMFFIEDRFLDDFLKSNSHLLEKKPIPQPSTDGIFKIVISPLFKSSLESIFPYFLHESTHSKELLKLKFTEILLHLLESDEGGNFLFFLKNLFSQRKKDLVSVMEKNFAKPITVNEFARLSGRSLTTFKKEFQQLYKQPPKQWINQKRLARAYSLLSTAEKNVTEVCFEVGFENISYFSQLFKNRYKISPKELQKARN
ncbi:MAG: AraC family transcriptional regulator [Proteobacteria bacterium]|nr:AraC family transcriptional regulator [Pseudomonadota bacterium]MBU1736512.1 AraC family transcriptional regulator [Pseudomonadota bacterium]